MRRFLSALLLVSCAMPASHAGAQEIAPDLPPKRAVESYTDAEVESALRRPLTLDDCLRIALAKNLPLRIVRSELHKAERTHWGSYGRFLPELSVFGSRQRSVQDWLGLPTDSETVSRSRGLVGRVSQFLPTGTALSVSRELTWLRESSAPPGPLSAGQDRLFLATLSQPLLRSGPTVAGSIVGDADYGRRGQEQLLEDATRQTLHLTRLAYYEVLRGREVVRISGDALRSDSTLVQASEAMLTAKLATRRDILSAQIRLADDRAGLVSAEKDHDLAVDQLKDVLGLPLDAAIEVAGDTLTFTPVEVDADQLIQLADTGPAVRASDLAVRRSRLKLKVARNSALPSFDLRASYSHLLNRQDGSILEPRKADWGASLNLTYPLLSRDGAAAAEIARLGVSQEEDRRAIVRRKIALDVRDAVRSLHSIAEEIAAIQRSIEAAQEKIEFATAMFNLGRASNLDITDAREALLKSRTQYVRRLAEYHGQLSALESLTGLPLAQ